MTPKQIESALVQVRDTKQPVEIGPYRFSFEMARGLPRCKIEQTITVKDWLTGEPVPKLSLGGFAFPCVSLKRVAASLARSA